MAVQIITHIYVIVPYLRIVDNGVDMMSSDITAAAYVQILVGKILTAEYKAIHRKDIIHCKQPVQVSCTNNDIYYRFSADILDRSASDMLNVDSVI